jgi:hypothetical protein
MLLLLSLLVAFYFEYIMYIYKRRTFLDIANLASEDKQKKQGQCVCGPPPDTLYSGRLVLTSLVYDTV